VLSQRLVRYAYRKLSLLHSKVTRDAGRDAVCSLLFALIRFDKNYVWIGRVFG
jgi:hypothetical protein